ncbi:MAG: type II toxin-antitoxin system RelE/ParE family toxin [Geobacter sp.]|nr:type II toxin-antitoxin system RelE/ParE family toxin [Geobacter sp.]
MTETPYQLKYYLDENGNAPFLGWLYSLRDKMAVYRIRARLDRVELGNFGTVKPVGDGVSELKIDHGPGYRVYFAMSGKTVVLLLIGGDKSSQQSDINTAKGYWKHQKEA